MSEIANRDFSKNSINNQAGRKLTPETDAEMHLNHPEFSAGAGTDFRAKRKTERQSRRKSERISEREPFYISQNRKDELISEFISEMTKDCKTPEEKLVAVLKARGFLLEESDSDICLSDNSCLKNPGYQCSSSDLDQTVLAGFLKGSNLGTLDMTYDDQNYRETLTIDPDHFHRHYYPPQNHPAKFRLNITGIPEYNDLYHIIEIFHGFSGSTIFGPNYAIKKDEELFYGHEHGVKVPACIMDAGIARFCKAVSACGVTTKMTCDGHFGEKRYAWILFNTHLDLLWFRILNECIIIPLLNPNLKFRYGSRMNSDAQGDVNISLTRRNPLPEYMEMQRIAEFLYEHRVIFRELKKEICKDYQNHYPGLDDLRDYERSGEIPKHILNQLRMRTNTLLKRELYSQKELPYTEAYKEWMLRIFENKTGITNFLTKSRNIQEDYTGILQELIQIYSPSGREQELSEFIARKYGKGNWEISADELSNLYIKPKNDDGSEKLPLLNAHLDTYPLYYEGQEEEAEHIKRLSRYNNRSRFRRDNHIKPEFNAGFDDKAGVAMILYLMKHTSLRFRAVLTVQEEQAVSYPAKYGRGGGGGIGYAIENRPEFFRNSAYALTLDRQGGRDIIDTYGRGSEDSPRLKLCSDEFLEKFIDTSNKVYYPMTVAEGSIADAYNIRAAFPELDILNISAGFYEEHRSTEWFNIEEALGVMRVVAGFLSDC
ncbi:hypothetical protein [Methanoplanus endosymbiosus]|uniref:M20/M25/M40 family metallo-hydrolase n=1 Tax=Methanoplanus endosymbiosus TaxID=33865 RepID=A0A9E7TKD2_9EURY|nr:hypothetical protein [Methanoplanus endosymbiosus]UUX92520.1 hypothetical protein L6E24_14490 [Methanoplanus endosymbiosus]